MTYNKKWKSYILPFVFLVSMWSCVGTNLTESEISDEKIYKQLDVMPYFPDCKNIDDEDKRQHCSIIKTRGFIYDNLEYPVEWIGKGGGKVSIRFVVNREGDIVNPEILYDSNGFGEAVIKALETMPRWIPYTKAGVPIDITRHLYIDIDEKQYLVSDTSETLKSDEGNFTVPKKMAYVTECKGMTDGNKQVCNKQHISQCLIYGGINIGLYRDDTGENHQTFLKFTVDREGNITNIKTQCGDEHEKKLIKEKLTNMPQWIPAKHNDKSVNVELVFSCRMFFPGY